MPLVAIPDDDDFAAFRAVARRLADAAIPPTQVDWQCGGRDLFGNGVAGIDAAPSAPFMVPSGFFALAQDVVCHRDRERHALLYELLWRLLHGERTLLGVVADPLVHRLMRLQKAVRRDSHKMTAFLRFRRVESEDGEHFVAGFEPDHHIVRRVSSFFVDRFAAMRWSILTPDASMAWDRSHLTFGPGVPVNVARSHDERENWWRTYYRATFNPARANEKAMRAEMPKKYWKHLLEAALIPRLLDEAGRRTQQMVSAEPRGSLRKQAINPAGQENERRHFSEDVRAGGEAAMAKAAVTHAGLGKIEMEARACTRCPLYKNATQTVFGEGAQHAEVVFVGEQPGDQEDLEGRPFVGPAGKLFDAALEEAGIDRARVYVTNAVKHFKFEPRGKRRIHKKPNAGEIRECRWWLDQEIDAIRPKLTVALGATAARALAGHEVKITDARGKGTTWQNGLPGFVTVHPSFLLRMPDPEIKKREFRHFVADLKAIAAHTPRIRLA